MAYTEQTIIVKNPSKRLMDFVERVKAYKRDRREQMRLQREKGEFTQVIHV